jgi:hypothetical protein
VPRSSRLGRVPKRELREASMSREDTANPTDVVFEVIEDHPMSAAAIYRRASAVCPRWGWSTFQDALFALVADNRVEVDDHLRVLRRPTSA